MTNRTKKILRCGIRDFIETGKSITSGRLYKNHDFGIKPAMIRKELSELQDKGYLHQIHTSGGRFPTNKAYRYFVGKLLEDNPRMTRKSVGTSILDEFMSQERRSFARELANYLEALSVVYEPSKDSFYNSGLKELFDNIDFEEKSELSSIVEDFEKLERRLMKKKKWWEKEKQWPQVFIGESPVTESRQLAVVAQQFSTDKDKILILAIGPRRMDYRKPIGLFKYLEQNIKNYDK